MSLRYHLLYSFYQARHLEFQGWSTCSNHTAHDNLRASSTLIFPTAEQLLKSQEKTFILFYSHAPPVCQNPLVLMNHSLSKGTIFQQIFRTSWVSSLICFTFPFSIKPSHPQKLAITTLLPPSYSKQNGYQCFFLYLNKANKDGTFPRMDSQG